MWGVVGPSAAVGEGQESVRGSGCRGLSVRRSAAGGHRRSQWHTIWADGNRRRGVRGRGVQRRGVRRRGAAGQPSSEGHAVRRRGLGVRHRGAAGQHTNTGSVRKRWDICLGAWARVVAGYYANAGTARHCLFVSSGRCAVRRSRNLGASVRRSVHVCRIGVRARKFHAQWRRDLCDAV